MLNWIIFTKGETIVAGGGASYFFFYFLFFLFVRFSSFVLDHPFKNIKNINLKKCCDQVSSNSSNQLERFYT